MTEKIATAEDLDALPVGSVVLDRDNTAWQKVEGGAWVAPDDLDEGWPSEDLSEERPRFLYRPDAPAPSTEDRESLAEFLFWRWREDHPGSLTWESFGQPKALFYDQADAALAWFAARRPAPTVSAETMGTLDELCRMDDEFGMEPSDVRWVRERAQEIRAALAVTP